MSLVGRKASTNGKLTTMHLKSLTLKGFKSFASSTTMKFEPGICAVVGPNGSGKSNVVDALAWVMGEQGAKNLRGGKMQDVIFAGAGDRKPLGRAEVTLTFDNSDKHLPVDFTEVAITRRMFRDGASEYEINGSKARLMDIQELLSDSGIGREMHIIVGQGKLSEILESRPEERRAFIEEAAGVLKHRRRKEKAQRKLQSMQGNVDRLQDLTDELGKQLKPLERQAEAAKRAATVQATLRDARLRLAGHQMVTLQAAHAQSDESAKLLEEQVETVTASLESAEEQYAQLEEEQREVQPRAQESQETWFALSSLEERANATLRIAQERAHNLNTQTEYHGQDPEELLARAAAADEEYEVAIEAAEEAAERLEVVREDVAEYQAAFDEAEREHVAQIQAVADRREGVVRLVAQEEAHQQAVLGGEQEATRLEEQLSLSSERAHSARGEAEEVAEKIAELEARRGPLVHEYEQASSELTAAEQRFQELQMQQREHERAVFTLQSKIETLQHQMPTRTAEEMLGGYPALASLVKAPADLAGALAAALDGFSEALVGERDLDVVEQLQSADRASIVEAVGGALWRVETDGCYDWLLDHLDVDVSVAGPVARLLADVVVVETPQEGVDVVKADPRLRAVTREGALFGEGWMSVGIASASTVEVSAQVEAAQRDLRTAEHALAELSGTFEGAQLAAEDARVNVAAAKAALREHDTEVASWQREHQRLAAQSDTAEQERVRAAQQLEEAEQRLAQRREQLLETQERLSRIDDTPAAEGPSPEARDAASQQLTQAKAIELEAVLAARETQQRAQTIAGKGDALRRQAENERQAKARHDAAVARRRSQALLAGAVKEHTEVLISRVQDALQRATAQRDELQRTLAALQGRIQQERSQVSAARQQLNRLSDRAHAADIARSQAKVRLEEAQQKIVESLGISVDDLLANFAPGEDFDESTETQRLRQAEKDLRSLGKVNPLALEEFKALEERYTFLSTQLADVIQARKDLLDVIEDVDAHILQLFTDAWHDVEEEFPRVFHTLFPGGEARLILTEPDDMLLTGIEIEARPPGKRVKRLSLLSGGEKSLTALAFLVAIFRARPSPFYVLDEVEAALDDVNLRRLIALLEELRQDSQLIVITHQKPTMNVANVLYGVTMRGDGVTRVLSQRMRPAGSAPDSDPDA